MNKLADGFAFTEGPAADASGDVYFSDIPKSLMYKWSFKENKLTLARENTGGANGLWINKDGTIFACEGVKGRVVSLTNDFTIKKVIASQYNQTGFNKPNDLWVDNKGGVYFTDPNYGRKITPKQHGENAYYCNPQGEISQITNDLARPNGIIGTLNGETLYIADHKGGKTWSYDIQPSGNIANKTLLAEEGSDGMTLDNKGNIYLTTDAVLIYSPKGNLLQRIETPERPANVCFGVPGRDILFITARKGIYSIKMNVKGMY